LVEAVRAGDGTLNVGLIEAIATPGYALQRADVGVIGRPPKCTPRRLPTRRTTTFNKEVGRAFEVP
jgi:hypothetical protein